MALGNIILLTIFATVVALLCLRASSSVLARGERTKIVPMPDRMPSITQTVASAPESVPNLTRAALAVLTRGCDPNGRTSSLGVACTAHGIKTLLSSPEDQRFDSSRRTPCTRATTNEQSFCVPYFYVLGVFHAGVRDLYDRVMRHPHAFVPKALTAHRHTGSYPYFFTETHPWELMLWRGCDYGGCPRRRGVGAEPLALSELPELHSESRGAAHVQSTAAGGQSGAAAREVFFGEVAGGAFTFTWSSAHSLLHHAWDRNQSACREPPPRTACFPAACAAQVEYEDSIGAGRERALTIPWLMRAVHGHEHVRLIALLREPGARMFSAYFFWPQYRRRYGLGPAAQTGFGKYAAEMVAAFRACLRAEGGEAAAEGRPEARAALESCAINFESLSAANEGVYYHADQLLKSLYAAYLPSWHAAFGREKLLVLRAEDYWRAPAPVLQQVFSFLGVSDALTPDALRAAAAQPISVLPGSNATFWGDKRVVNVHPARGTRAQGAMPPEARALLSDFFAPYNARLAALLGDARFEWRDVLGGPQATDRTAKA